MSKILITGGAGYIGPHVNLLLTEANESTLVVDNLSTGHKENIQWGEFLNIDLSNKSDLESVFENNDIEAVIHFAGSIIVSESVEKPLEYYRNNTANTLNLLECCQKYNINKFIFSSTAAVYGNPKNGVVSEEDDLCPINPYGQSKLMTENMIEDFAKANESFKFVILRYFNVAGADLDLRIGQKSKVSTHLIKLANEVALGKRQKLSIFGNDYDTEDGTCVRDYIHVLDLAQAHLDALTYLRKENSSNIFNCGYGRGFSVKQVVKAVKEISKNDFEVVIDKRRAGDPPVLVSSNEKIKKILNWKPKYNDLNLIVRTALDYEKTL